MLLFSRKYYWEKVEYADGMLRSSSRGHWCMPFPTAIGLHVRAYVAGEVTGTKSDDDKERGDEIGSVAEIAFGFLVHTKPGGWRQWEWAADLDCAGAYLGWWLRTPITAAERPASAVE